MSCRSKKFLLILLFVSGPGFAEAYGAYPSDEAEINRAVVRIIKEGVTLYNVNGDAAGCYRVYQGGLIGLNPFLAAWPELQAMTNEALSLAESKADRVAAAFTLRDALNQIYEATKSIKPVTNNNTKPLWDRLGGQPAVEAVVHDFVQLVAADRDVNFLRGGKYQLDADRIAKLERLLVELLSSVTGGPLRYSGRGMKEVHEGMEITDAEFGALAADLVAVLRKYKVDKKEVDELISIIATTKADMVESNDTSGSSPAESESTGPVEGTENPHSESDPASKPATPETPLTPPIPDSNPIPRR